MTSRKKAKKKFPILAVLIGVLAVVVCICGVEFVSSLNATKKAESYLNNLAAENQESVQKVVNTIQVALSGSSGATRAFNKQNKLLFQFRSSTGVNASGGFPEEFLQEFKHLLVERTPIEKLTNDVWLNAHVSSLFSQADTRALDDAMRGSLGVATVDVYCQDTMQATSDDARFILARELESRFTESELTLYCASVLNFGDIKGVHNAAAQLFGKQLADLSRWQQLYLVQLYNDPDVTWEEFRLNRNPFEIPEEAESGLLSASGASTLVLRDKVESELKELVGSRISEENFDVELQLDELIQYDMQSVLDSAFSANVSMQTDGKATLDGIVMLIDTQTGYVKSFVNGRTVSSLDEEFYLHEKSELGAYQAVRKLFTPGGAFTYNSLVNYQTPSGDTDYISIRMILGTDQLNVLDLTPVLSSTATIEELANFCMSLYYGSGVKPRFISQIVQTGSDKAVYTTSPLTSRADEFDAVNTRMFFTNRQSDTIARYRKSYSTGQVFADISSTYILCGIVGTNTLGYGLSEDDNDLLSFVVEQLVKVPEKYFQGKQLPMNNVQEYVDVFNDVDNRNASLVESITTAYVDDLESKVIASKEGRLAFENSYMEYVNSLARYADVLSVEALADQIARLDSVRANRSKELLAYVA